MIGVTSNYSENKSVYCPETNQSNKGLKKTGH